MSEIKLLQCPFCGGKMKIVDVSESCLYAGRYIFNCENGCIKSHSFMTEQEAVRACNTRKPMERIAEQLEDAKSMVPVNRLLDDIIKDKPKELGQLMAYDKAIKIVKAGGVE